MFLLKNISLSWFCSKRFPPLSFIVHTNGPIPSFGIIKPSVMLLPFYCYVFAAYNISEVLLYPQICPKCDIFNWVSFFFFIMPLFSLLSISKNLLCSWSKPLSSLIFSAFCFHCLLCIPPFIIRGVLNVLIIIYYALWPALDDLGKRFPYWVADRSPCFIFLFVQYLFHVFAVYKPVMFLCAKLWNINQWC